ncbi:hypothetical protein [Pyrococcus yayanosii]|uniref:KaiC-like domain-containing protein n=1 Tax=Pyrococcus yayanosii (strain CH1 / JCM 16557) TaxID=529709 RepID=F8AHB4_PYRYC|nr:hypothetical protein [Pyrococcus yayanosii]AEH24111.1 hypothetical protein PYCH_04210 [Pyrococcus yayanosii CH1]
MEKEEANEVLEVFKITPEPGTVVSIIHDTYSAGWQIFFGIIAELLEKGYFPVISNYNLPLPNLFKRASAVGLNMRRELENDKMAIIDVFGSKYGLTYDFKNTYYLQGVDPDTLNPKISMIYDMLRPKMKGKELIRAVYTLGGAAMMLGEEEVLKLLSITVAQRIIQFPNSILLMLMNRDVLSKRFIAWVSEMSDYVIVTRSELTSEGIMERLYVVKSPSEGFMPSAYRLHIAEEKTKERIRVERLSP